MRQLELKKAYSVLFCKPLIFKLPDQVSNLNSSDPESQFYRYSCYHYFFKCS